MLLMQNLQNRKTHKRGNWSFLCLCESRQLRGETPYKCDCIVFFIFAQTYEDFVPCLWRTRQPDGLIEKEVDGISGKMPGGLLATHKSLMALSGKNVILCRKIRCCAAAHDRYGWKGNRGREVCFYYFFPVTLFPCLCTHEVFSKSRPERVFFSP